MDVDTLRGILVAGIVVVIGLSYYLIRLIFQTMGRVKIVPVAVTEVTGTPWERTWLQEMRLLERINAAHKDCGWEYRWIGPVKPNGEIVLAWREWTEATGEKDRTLDVLFVKSSGEVETLGTCVEYEVFGPPEETK